MKHLSQISKVTFLGALAMSFTLTFGSSDTRKIKTLERPEKVRPAVNINDKQENQTQRIREGIQSGELTRPEVKRLVTQQKTIQNMENRAKADGVVTKKEYRAIQQAQKKASKSIYVAKHNDKTPTRTPNNTDKRKLNKRFQNSINDQQSQQASWVRRALKSGELTRKEAKAIIQHQKNINRMEKKFLEDGKMTPAEYRQLQSALNRAEKFLKKVVTNDKAPGNNNGEPSIDNAIVETTPEVVEDVTLSE